MTKLELNKLADEKLTEGAVVALARLKDGDMLEREHNRSKSTWISDGKYFHHFTFKILKSVGAIQVVTGRDGFTTFGISEKGERLLEPHLNPM